MLVGISGKIYTGKDMLAQTIIRQLLGMSMPWADTTGLPPMNSFTTYDSSWFIKKFADPLKDILCILTGCTRINLEDPQFKARNMPPEWNRWVVRRNDDLFKGIKASKWYVTADEAEACKMDLVRLNKGNDVYSVLLEPITYRIALQEIGTDLFRDKFHPNTWVNAMFAKYQPVPGSRHWAGHAITIGDPPGSGQYPNWIITDVRFPNEARAIKERGGKLVRMNRDHLVTSTHESETALDDYDGFDAVVDNNGALEDLQRKAISIIEKFNLQ